MGFSSTFILAPFIFLVPIFGLLIKYVLASRRPRNFPPGPSTLPIIGNLHQLPPKKAFLKFHELGNTYGSIIGLKLGPQNVVILNSHRHVAQLFDKRGSIYSSRPDSYIANTLVCPNETHILLIPYNAGWRKIRKIVQSLLTIPSVDSLLPLQNAEATQTLYELLTQPDGYYDHIRRYTTAVILASVFGQRGESFESPKVQRLYHAQDQFTAILEQGATPPVDAFPFLKYVPEVFASWKTRAKRVREAQRNLYFDLLEDTKKRIREGKAGDCFLASILERQEKQGFDDEHMAYIGGVLMEAGSDTTSSTLLSFLLAMVAYPDTLKKAQDEIDTFCSASKSPISDDIPNLPYLRACMDETGRWRPVVAGGIPHMLTQDDTYSGYFLPKGTVLFANAWSIHHDSSEYANPDSFIPERFLNNRFGTMKLVSESEGRRETYGFGAGRRVCPGQRLSENALMISMAKLVWAFDMLPRSEEPVDVDIETAFTDGFATGPKKFPIRFVARSKQREEVIRKEFEAAKQVFAKYED